MPWNSSLADWLAQQTPSAQATLLRDLSPEQRNELAQNWRFLARPGQRLPPGDHWTIWLLLAGRGYGKTHTGSANTNSEVSAARAGRVALVGPTAADARDVMVEGPTGILATASRENRATYEPSKRRIVWANGAIGTLYSAEEPERLRGPQHDFFWADELAAWKYLQEAWDQLMFGLRMGVRPRGIVTTTPKPLKLIRELVARADCVVTRGTTAENRKNLSPAFLRQVVSRYEGTRLGRQELDAELLEDVPGALWAWKLIEGGRRALPACPAFSRIVVAIDPAVTSTDQSDETGILVAAKGADGHAYVLRDLSGRLPPIEWCRRAIGAYRDLKADRVVAEVNNGGDLVETQLRVVDPSVAYKGIHASRGKRVRAEPVAALYEQGRVHHVGTFPGLEDQMVTFVPDERDDSPDRVDALVYALTELMLVARAPLIG
jgi:phage terminase large subunit-like protein